MGRKSNSKFPGRNLIFKKIREKNTCEAYTDSRGNVVYLNLTKRILLDKPYKSIDYENDRRRQFAKMERALKEKTKGEVSDN